MNLRKCKHELVAQGHEIYLQSLFLSRSTSQGNVVVIL